MDRSREVGRGIEKWRCHDLGCKQHKEMLADASELESCCMRREKIGTEIQVVSVVR